MQPRRIQLNSQGKQASLILVGNGPIGVCGNQIDGFDRVVRFNRYVLKGYEDRVGCRHDILATYVTMGRDEELFLRNVPACNEIWINTPLTECMHKYPGYTLDWLAKCKDKNLLFCEHSLWEDFCSYYHFPEDAIPSTGICAIHQAIYLGYRVSIVGFAGGYGGHYWNNMHVHYSKHNWAYEIEIIESLLEKQLIEKLE